MLVKQFKLTQRQELEGAFVLTLQPLRAIGESGEGGVILNAMSVQVLTSQSDLQFDRFKVGDLFQLVHLPATPSP